jgi:hypothetical protein|nr:MAG TPA: head closure knob [Caudoviricetes sp.]
MLNEAKILSKTYHDKMSVYRKILVKDTETFESKLKDVLIYKDIPCALSLSSNSVASRGTITNETNNDFKVFAAPHISCNENDKVIVITASNDKYIGRVSKSFRYISHSQTELKKESV